MFVLVDLVAKELLEEGNCDIKSKENGWDKNSFNSTTERICISAKILFAIHSFHHKAMNEIKDDFAMNKRDKADYFAKEFLERIFLAFLEVHIPNHRNHRKIANEI